MVSGHSTTRRNVRWILTVALGVVVTASVSVAPAEARRKHRIRHHGGASQAYDPPFAAIVIDAKTGKTLYAKNPDARRHPASITKVMTLYMLFEQLEQGRMRLDTPLRVSAHAASMPPSKLGVRPGGTISVENAIKALVTRSANDIASAIGENIGGSEARFAQMMTRKARALGMTGTVYVNASGLPDTRQITTARDLGILARAVQDRFPQYYGYFSTRSFQFGSQTIGNHNRLLGAVEGVDGIKTGYTRMSGFNLMTSARANGRHVVGIVLGGRSGAIRDRIMASLVAEHMPTAYAGARIAPLVGESGAAVRVAAATAPRPEPRPADLPARGVRPVVASASASDTATPSTFRWVAPRNEQDSAAVTRLAYAPESEPAAPRELDSRGLARLIKNKANKPARQAAAAEAPAAEAETAPVARGGSWVIQLGATEDEASAKQLLADARGASEYLKTAAPFTEKVVRGKATLWRARFSGFGPKGAQDACRALKDNGYECFATRG
ncbi:penicillin-binding protein [Camelimonas fluminis]|uniref:D-alanyl-D-alanine carboxypeptidase n=1 Tax=Camelimonas fluminis TaxID=1576911 RepID=A0ABV7UKR6_9HYPH|nr:D-alanyl-D-alanine carboxypeptidase [Camelimonas fluminis]GHE58953.1 penicillin-binding protein [Camelimonas fluminis]